MLFRENRTKRAKEFGLNGVGKKKNEKINRKKNWGQNDKGDASMRVCGQQENRSRPMI